MKSACLPVSLLLVLLAGGARSQGFEWTATLNGPANGQDFGHVMTHDAAGNVFVAGSTETPSSGTDVLVAGYTPAGALLWQAQYNGPGNGDDACFGVTVDLQGNVILVANVSGPANGDMGVLKYSPSGALLWTFLYDSSFHGWDGSDFTNIEVSAQNELYVTGLSSGASTEGFTLKLDAAGQLLWQRSHVAPGSSSNSSWVLAQNSNGDLYVGAETFTPASANDMWIRKFSAAGTLLWDRQYTVTQSSNETLYAIALDAQENLVLTGVTNASLSGHSNYLTVAYDPAGNLLWSDAYDGPAGKQDIPFAIAADSQGRIAVTGVSEGSLSTSLATVVYDTAGTRLWSDRYDSPSGYWGNSWGASARFDPQGNLFVAGPSYGGPTTGFDGAVLMYAPPGHVVKRWVFDSAIHSNDYLLDLTIGNDGSVYAGGYSLGSQFNQDFLVLKLQRPELLLTAQPTAVTAGQTLTLTTQPGQPGTIGMLVIREVNGTPLFQRVALGPFLSTCQWTIAAPVPSGLGGIQVQFEVYGWDTAGRLVVTPQVMVSFL